MFLENEIQIRDQIKAFKPQKPPMFANLREAEGDQAKDLSALTRQQSSYDQHKNCRDYSSTCNSTPVNNSSSSFLNYTVVTKYMNLPSKAGIGYQLSNGDYGMLFNDESKLVLKVTHDKMFYFDRHDLLLYSTAYSKLNKLSGSATYSPINKPNFQPQVPERKL